MKKQKEKIIQLPMTRQDALSLRVGDMVLLNGRIVTGRDKAHRFLYYGKRTKRDLPFDLRGSVIYHCGPIISRAPEGYMFIAGGPTTSMRLEMYEHRIIADYGLRGVMGKGGMGKKTLEALRKNGCVYFHTVGGAAVYLAQKIKKIVDVWKLEEFGMTEAMWLLEVENFPAVVTMDAHGNSLHEQVKDESKEVFKRLVGLR